VNLKRDGELPSNSPGGSSEVITELNQHIGRAEDESDVWLPARLAPAFREALDGYERGKQGPGQHTFAELLEATQSSVIRFEMRDSYDETDTTEKGFAAWKATGSTDAYEWGDHLDVVRAAVARGVRIRRVRIVSEPISEYMRWEYATGQHRSRRGHPVATPYRRGRPHGSRCRLLGLRPPRCTVELPARRRHQPASLHIQLRPPDHPRHHRRIRDGVGQGDAARRLQALDPSAGP
jgi:hypothetical protein